MFVYQNTYCPQCMSRECSGDCNGDEIQPTLDRFEKVWSDFERGNRLALSQCFDLPSFDSVDDLELFHRQLTSFMRHALRTGWNGAVSGGHTMKSLTGANIEHS